MKINYQIIILNFKIRISLSAMEAMNLGGALTL